MINADFPNSPKADLDEKLFEENVAVTKIQEV